MTSTTGTVLCHVRSVIDDWPHRNSRYNGVRVDWIVTNRMDDPNFDYSALLDRPLPPGDGYSYEQGLVDELFTAAEARQFAAWLKDRYDEDCEIEEVTLPIRTREGGAGLIPISAIPAGGDTDFYMIWKDQAWDLPFQVDGFFRIDHRDPETVLVSQRCPHTCEHRGSASPATPEPAALQAAATRRSGPARASPRRAAAPGSTPTAPSPHGAPRPTGTPSTPRPPRGGGAGEPPPGKLPATTHQHRRFSSHAAISQSDIRPRRKNTVMTSVNCTVTVPLSGNGMHPVDRVATATWLRRVRQPPVLAELADAIEHATGDTAKVRVRMTAVNADQVRHLFDDLVDSATNPSQGWPREQILLARRASYGLRVLSRAWDECTGYNPAMRRLSTDGEEDLGNGYRR